MKKMKRQEKKTVMYKMVRDKNRFGQNNLIKSNAAVLVPKMEFNVCKTKEKKNHFFSILNDCLVIIPNGIACHLQTISLLLLFNMKRLNRCRMRNEL